MWTDNIAEIDVLNYRPYCDVLMDGAVAKLKKSVATAPIFL